MSYKESLVEKHFAHFQGISYQLPTGESLLDNISLSINPGDRIALVGRNGVGKSTLLKIIDGQLTPTNGLIQKEGDAAYVPQVTLEMSSSNISLMDYLSKADEDWWNIVEAYERVFGDFSFDPTREINKLSGGELVKVNIAYAIGCNPGILLLDEPTNHLDSKSRESLKKFLETYDGGVVIVSHDPVFLDQVVDKVWELEDTHVKVYGGNYKEYREQKQTQIESKGRQHEVAQKEIEKINRSIAKEQQRAARSHHQSKVMAGDRSMPNISKGYFAEKAGQSAGRIGRQLEKRKEEIKKRVDETIIKTPKKVRVNLHESDSRKGKRLFLLNDDTLIVGGKTLIDNINFELAIGNRVCISGENGSGKTTFLKHLTENSPEIKYLYLSQNYDNVDPNKSLLENIFIANPGITLQQARQTLGNFLFRDKYTVDKKASMLSGGEIAKLSLAMACVSPVDLLILDEPTNNLDIETLEMVADSLAEFRGAILIVSHNQYFLKKLKIKQTYTIRNRQLLISN